MKKKILFFAIYSAIVCIASAHTESPNLAIIAPGTLAATSVALVWDKPEDHANIIRYHILLNGKEVATSEKCNYLLRNLSSATSYSCKIQSEDKTGKLSPSVAIVNFTTRAKGAICNITGYGAKGDGTTLNTKSIQQAIDACPAGGTVLIPQGIFLSGALFLKSHITLEIAKGGVLKGSSNEADYQPLYNNRFEGWEMKTYASLINAGVMNHNGGFSVEELSIKGEGTVSGGGEALAKAMIAKSGLRSRGRLICLMNCKNVELQGLQIQDSPCWTIHYIYCQGVSCHDLNIVSTVHNGDGLDPDSSDDSYIFNCTFSTGDDCIAIKSGKNPEGFIIAKPTRNVRITDCDFVKGHGISIGSEMSGGVSDVLVQDCKAGKLLHGMQIKGQKERGAYVRNVTVTDCQLLAITVYTELNYNNDGAAAPEVPLFENFTFKHIDLTKATDNDPVIDINGFKTAAHHLKNLIFDDITLPENGKIVLKDADGVKFINVKTVSGTKPFYFISNSSEVVK